MSIPKMQIACEVEVSVMNSVPDSMPSGRAQCHFMDDGSLMASFQNNQDTYAVKGGTKLQWQYGLMGLINKEHLYLSIGIGISAKVIDQKFNQEIESWLILNHPIN